MAGGFDAAVGVGLLGGLNRQYENAQKQQAEDQDYGDKQQLQVFLQQAKEYDKKKSDQADLAKQIEDGSTALAAQGNGGKGYAVGPDTRAVVRDAINNGIYGKPEYQDYMVKALESTHSDMLANPDKWNVKLPKPSVFDQDTNPQQTSALSRFGQNPGLQSLEEQRSGQLPSDATSELPGAKMPPMNDYLREQAQGKSEASAAGKTEAGLSPEAQELAGLKAKMAQSNSLSQFGYNPDGTPMQQGANGQPQPNTPPTGASAGAATPTAPNPTQAPAAPVSAAGAPPPQAGTPSPDAGISVSGNAPPQQSSSMHVNASDLPPQQQGQPQSPAPTTPVNQGAQNNASSPIAPQSGPDALKKQYPTAQGIQERNWAALNKLTPNDQKLVVAMSEGEIPIPTIASGRGPSAAHNVMLVGTLKDFDSSANAQRYKTNDMFQNGTDATTIQAINTAMSHVNNLRDASIALDNKDTNGFNKIGNAYASQLGKPAPTSYAQLEHYVSEELQKVYAGTKAGGGSLEELNQIRDTLDRNQSPTQFNSTFRNIGDLLDGKLSALNATYQRGKGLAYRPNDWMAPEARQTYDKLKSYGHDGQPVDNQDRPIDPRAIEMLNKNPQTAPMFEQQFGRPAAAYIRGQNG